MKESANEAERIAAIAKRAEEKAEKKLNAVVFLSKQDRERLALERLAMKRNKVLLLWGKYFI